METRETDARDHQLDHDGEQSQAARAGSAGGPAATPRVDPKAFRQRLDAILRQRDPAALRAFLVAEGQWAPETTTDPEAAMWMMIAASPALASMHGEAEHWLTTHGHAAEARAILGQGQTGRGGGQKGTRGGGTAKRGGPGGKGGSGKPR